ncbi:MAG: tetratricopeptide repeat protein, partial [Myxococcales bacterium]
MREGVLAAVAVAMAGCATVRPDPAAAWRARQWRELTSDGFVLQTDLDAADAASVVGHLERMRARLLRLLSMKPASSRRLQVVAFATGAELQPYLPSEANAAIAFFLRDAFGRERILLSGDLGEQQQRAIAHEVAHFLVYSAVVRQPRWFSEGMATFLEIAVTGGELPKGLARTLGGGLVPAHALFDWIDDRDVDPKPRYATSWLLLHFLSTQRARELAAFEERLARAEDPAAAWNAAFAEWRLDSKDALERLDGDLLAHWKGSIAAPEPPDVEAHPQFSARPMPRTEVYTLRLELPRRWTADQLRREISEALEIDPGHVGALTAQAALDPKSAPGLARAAIAAHPGDARAWVLLGSTLVDDSRAAEREAALRNAVELAPDRLEAALPLAEYLLSSGRTAESLAVSTRAVEAAPWSSLALLAHARALSAAGRCQEALSTGRHAIDVLGHSVRQDARDRAFRDVSDLERTCGSPEAMRAYALVRKALELSRREELAQAAKLLEQAVALDPRDRSAWTDLGMTYRRLGRTSDAIAAFHKQLELVPDQARSWNGLGWALLDAGKVDEAEGAFRRELEISAEDRGGLLSLGRLLNRIGRPRDAAVPLEKLVHLEPRSTAARIALGRSQIQAGNLATGLATLEAAQ